MLPFVQGHAPFVDGDRAQSAHRRPLLPKSFDSQAKRRDPGVDGARFIMPKFVPLGEDGLQLASRARNKTDTGEARNNHHPCRRFGLLPV
jgi:hypothetical protein